MNSSINASTAVVSFNPFVPSTIRSKLCFPSKFSSRNSLSIGKFCCSQNDSPQEPQQQVNLSVLRFTLGIPGLDESYLPRYIGYAFGALLVANRFLGSDPSSVTPAQLRTEALGLSLAAFSAVVPYMGRFLKGNKPVEQKTIPEGAEQIFVMSQEVADNVKEDLAWGTYALLRNTNSISVLISVQDALCVRGYWNTPKDLTKQDLVDWFRKQIQRIGLSNLKDPMYFQRTAESELKDMFPEGSRSVLVQPILGFRKLSPGQTENGKAFVLLASGIDYAYTDKDRAWIAAIANKFRGTEDCCAGQEARIEGMNPMYPHLGPTQITPLLTWEEHVSHFSFTVTVKPKAMFQTTSVLIGKNAADISLSIFIS